MVILARLTLRAHPPLQPLPGKVEPKFDGQLIHSRWHHLLLLSYVNRCTGRARSRSFLPSPESAVLGEEGHVPHLVLAEVWWKALLPVLPYVDGAAKEVLVHGYD
jgi:hypothetical protein